jgi:hypothetical protein
LLNIVEQDSILPGNGWQRISWSGWNGLRWRWVDRLAENYVIFDPLTCSIFTTTVVGQDSILPGNDWQRIFGAD